MAERADINSLPVVVCGATGFIGSHLVIHLLRGGYTNIRVIARSEKGFNTIKLLAKRAHLEDRYNSYVTEHIGEITNYLWLCKVVKGCHTLFNCASKVDVIGDSSSIIEENVTLTKSIATAAVECGIKRFVHLSSISALEVQPYPTLTNENSIPEDIYKKSPYAISKYLSEQEVLATAKEGVEVAVLLPAVVLGVAPNSKPTSSSAIVDKLKKGIPAYTCGVMGYVLVEDVAKAMILCGESEKAANNRYILCGANLSYRELITTISSLYNKRAPFIYIPKWLLFFAAKAINLLNKVGCKIAFSMDLASNLTDKALYDGTKITNHLNFKYTHIKNGDLIL